MHTGKKDEAMANTWSQVSILQLNEAEKLAYHTQYKTDSSSEREEKEAGRE